MISAQASGSTQNTEEFLKRIGKSNISSLLAKFGQEGVNALAAATPKETGKTASSWGYKVVKERNGWRVEWYNTNVRDNAQIAVLIQYGHGTGTGGYVAGIDYINPAMSGLFDRVVAEFWREVQR